MTTFTITRETFSKDITILKDVFDKYPKATVMINPCSDNDNFLVSELSLEEMAYLQKNTDILGFLQVAGSSK